jgi:hypothetical protein
MYKFYPKKTNNQPLTIFKKKLHFFLKIRISLIIEKKTFLKD